MEDQQKVIEDLLKEKEELLQQLEKYNNAIFDEDPISQTAAFDEEYQNLQAQYEENELALKKYHYQETESSDNIKYKMLNNTSIWLWILLTVLVILSIYPLFQLINLEVLVKIIQIDAVNNMDSFQKKILLLCGFFAYPLLLIVIDLLALIFIRKKEDKLIYVIGSSIFGLMVLSSTLIIFFNLI